VIIVINLKHMTVFQLSDASKTQLKVVEAQVQDHTTKGFWVIQLKESLQPGKSITVSYTYCII
jgi:hypothetical protein